MYSGLQPSLLATTSSLLAAEEQRMRKTYYAKRTFDNLVAAGLVEEPVAVPAQSRHRRRGPGSSSNANIEALGLQQSQRHSRWQSSKHHNTAGISYSDLSAATPPHNSHNPSGSVSSRSNFNWLHNDEMFAATKGSVCRERTFIGYSCAACEEPLEHMLRGERILQLSCGHVSHEACFYEYIKEFDAETCPNCDKPLGLDTTRGGNIDFENLNHLVRNAQTPDLRERPMETPTSPSWEPEHRHQSSTASQPISPLRPSRGHLLPERTQIAGARQQRYASDHGRNASADTGYTPSHGYYETRPSGARQHDYDVQPMDPSTNSERVVIKATMPVPVVTIRSEFPTLSKSWHQQSLTCLVTVEVAEDRVPPLPEDVQGPQSPPLLRSEDAHDRGALQPPDRPAPQRPVDSVHEDAALEEVKEDLIRRVDDWHGLDFRRFGKLLLHSSLRVGKDCSTWQELECYLFSDMLICVKERGSHPVAHQHLHEPAAPMISRYTLKGSILIKRHLKQVEVSPEGDVLTLFLTVKELPAFHLLIPRRHQLDIWHRMLVNITRPEPVTPLQPAFNHEAVAHEDGYHSTKTVRKMSPVNSPSQGAAISQRLPDDYTMCPAGTQDMRLDTFSLHVPLDLVVVVPVSWSVNGLKTTILRDSLRFLISNLGERDRMGLVTFGSSSGAYALVGMTAKSWQGWQGTLASIRPVYQKNARVDAVEGANVAMDLLMQRRWSNPHSHIMLISDGSSSDAKDVDFVVSRAEAAKIGIHSFGLGLTHTPDSLVDISTRTKANYTYVKDWMMLRDCLAGCLGSLQSTSHQNVKLQLRLPAGSPAKIVKIGGSLAVANRATGREAEVALGDLRLGDKRDILVQLAIQPEDSGSVPSDHWENIISGLEALGPIGDDDQGTLAVEELPLLQADLVWTDIVQEGKGSQLPRPSLLAISMLPQPMKNNPYGSPPSPGMPPHPYVVQRRLEMLTSDMLSRALGLVSKGQNDRAQYLLSETRSILQGFNKSGLPPPPTPPPTAALPPTPKTSSASLSDSSPFPRLQTHGAPSPARSCDSLRTFTSNTGIDRATMNALDSEIEASLEYISNPPVFCHDSRKAVLQAIKVISFQRSYTFRTPVETLWAARIPGVRRLIDRSREWRDIQEIIKTNES